MQRIQALPISYNHYGKLKQMNKRCQPTKSALLAIHDSLMLLVFVAMPQIPSLRTQKNFFVLFLQNKKKTFLFFFSKIKNKKK